MTPKYKDSKYHIEYKEHEYFGGYKESSWTIVNVFGENCRNTKGNTIRFTSKEGAQKYCDKLNICPEGGILTNLE